VTEIGRYAWVTTLTESVLPATLVEQVCFFLQLPLEARGGSDEEQSYLGEDDLLDITDYLMELSKTEVYNLGLVLGLSKHRVEDVMDSRSFLDEVITAWLQKVDLVKKRGAPTWQRLVEALRHQRIGQSDIADKIEKDRVP